MNMKNMGALGAIVWFLALAGCSDEMAPQLNMNAETVRKWVESSQDKAQAVAIVEAHMADDGVIYRPRYVGFGFTHDGYETGEMVVQTIVPDSPASAVLQVGDKFISVRGVEVGSDTMDRLDFRGKAGEAVEAVIVREGESMEISVVRGTIASTITKADMLEWMREQNAEDWADENYTVHEVIGSGDVIYAWTQAVNTDETSGASVDVHTVSRFQFNADGQVVALANINESRFALEQMGYTITR